MKQGIGSREQGTGKVVRGTQSFVGVMVEVWKRPGLTGIEIAWRWLAWVPLFAVAPVMLRSAGADVPLWTREIASISLFQPEQAVASVGDVMAGVMPLLGKMLWILVGMMVVWLVASSIGRAVILRRVDSGLKARWGAGFFLGLMRAGSLAAILLVWVAGLRWVVTVFVVQAAERGSDPNYVLAFALVVSATLVLFVLWCVVSWVLQLAPLMAMANDEGVGASIRDAMRVGPLRGKLMEINLVMGIVRVCLVVLAMVFSACPLPFSSVETQEFLNWWWAGVAVFYVVFSDYFHVVQAAAYLRLWQAYKKVPDGVSQGAEAAS